MRGTVDRVALRAAGFLDAVDLAGQLGDRLLLRGQQLFDRHHQVADPAGVSAETSHQPTVRSVAR
jgi:hypothetical protein